MHFADKEEEGKPPLPLNTSNITHVGARSLCVKLPGSATLLTVTKTYHRNVLGCLTAMCPQAHLAGRSGDSG